MVIIIIINGIFLLIIILIIIIKSNGKETMRTLDLPPSISMVELQKVLIGNKIVMVIINIIIIIIIRMKIRLVVGHLGSTHTA